MSPDIWQPSSPVPAPRNCLACGIDLDGAHLFCADCYGARREVDRAEIERIGQALRESRHRESVDRVRMIVAAAIAAAVCWAAVYGLLWLDAGRSNLR